MGQRTLLPDATELQLHCLKFELDAVVLIVRTARHEAFCPYCHQPSCRTHSHYERKLADLPWNGIPVLVRLRTRRFFCDTPGCGQRIFTERLPNTAAPHARRTERLSKAADWFTLAMGGEAGARLAGKVGIVTSGDTLLRQLRRMPPPAPPYVPRVLGIDDWAWRKGHRYGTILCDLERGRVVDLLPDRTVETLSVWLRSHPGVEIISRDRASAYAEAARTAAPKAIQVADRWHLLRNVVEALQRLLESKHSLLTQAAKAVATTSSPPLAVRPDASPPVPPPPIKSTSAERIRQAKRSRRYTRYETVMEMMRQGVSQCEISRQLAIGRRTVHRWVRAGTFPEHLRTKRSSCLDRYKDYLNRRHQEGCHNATRLLHELRAQGFRGSYGIVSHWVRHLRMAPDHSARVPTPPQTDKSSPRQTAWLLLQQPPDAQAYLEELCRRSPEIAAGAAAARELFQMIQRRDAHSWTQWLKMAEETPLARFAAHLQRDQAAVLAAMQLPWSNGHVEGQVHRLKLIKRQMYGRAKFDLLRQRVLYAA
jgi:transposase